MKILVHLLEWLVKQKISLLAHFLRAQGQGAFDGFIRTCCRLLPQPAILARATIVNQKIVRLSRLFCEVMMRGGYENVSVCFPRALSISHTD